MIQELQKADLWKRISAYIFDKIFVFILAVGFAFLLSIGVDFDSYSQKCAEKLEYYETLYNTDFEMSTEDYENLTEEGKTAYAQAEEALYNDAEAVRILSTMFNLTLIITIFGILISYMLLEFLVPMLFKNGQTLGKKIFGIAVMRIDGVKISPLLLMVRTLLGKYTIETMVPVLIIIGLMFGLVGFAGPVVILLILITNVAMFIATKTRSPIHDMLANTVTVDLASQMIFDTPEALLEYKQKIHEEEANKAQY